MRPPEVEQEIAEALGWPVAQILKRARIYDTNHEEYMTSECMVHLIRADLHKQERPLMEGLTPLLLERCAANLNYTVRGFKEPTLSTVREEILGKLAILLVEPDGAADFYEVKFSLSLMRLRYDFCHHFGRHIDRLVYADQEESKDLDHYPHGTENPGFTDSLVQDPELSYCLKQALSRLTLEERKVLLLHRLGGVAINAGSLSLVKLLKLSERTIRNRLRSAEAALAQYKEHRR